MKFLSLFSGIEACSVAWLPLGWTCVGFSEIEPYPCTLLEHYYPNVPNLGDVTQITEQQIARLGDFDALVFGSPCQDLSVAGARKGFRVGTRSSLFYEALRIFDYARKHNNCRFALWENVPGAFSSNKGADFAAVVREMAGLQDVPVPRYGWGSSGVAVGENGLLEWRVLDAQYFGLAQRRKRVFAVLDTGDWEGRPPILFERESLRGDTPPRRASGGEVAGAHGQSLANGSGVVGVLQANAGSKLWSGNQEVFSGSYHIIYPHSQETLYGVVAGNIIGRADKSGGNQFGVSLSDVSYTLNTSDRHAVITNRAIRILTPLECERLMGFPDGYTAIMHKGKQATDSVRYKALGNSIAVPVLRYIGQKIVESIQFADIKDEKMIPQSPTSLQTFLTCPRQYEAKYITREVEFVQNEHAVFGDLVHKSIENYLKHKEPLPSILRPLKTVLDNMGEVLWGAETKLAVDKQGNPVDFNDTQNAYQRCIVDAILTNKDKSIVVCVDWKTGKKRDAQTQHDFIKRCTRAKFPNAKVVTLFIYLFKGGYDRQEYVGGALYELDNNMNALAVAYANNSFPPKPSGLCRAWCDVLSCPHNGKS